MAAPARNNGTQNVQYLRKAFTYLDNGSTLEVGTLPAGAQIIKPMSGVAVNVAFNGDTTNTLDIGVSGDTDLYATDLALGSIAFVALDEAVSGKVSSDTTIYAVPVSSASASAGSGEIVIAFMAN